MKKLPGRSPTRQIQHISECGDQKLGWPVKSKANS